MKSNRSVGSRFERDVVDHLRVCGYTPIRASSGYDETQVCDIVVMPTGERKHTWLECKSVIDDKIRLNRSKQLMTQLNRLQDMYAGGQDVWYAVRFGDRETGVIRLYRPSEMYGTTRADFGSTLSLVFPPIYPPGNRDAP